MEIWHWQFAYGVRVQNIGLLGHSLLRMFLLRIWIFILWPCLYSVLWYCMRLRMGTNLCRCRCIRLVELVICWAWAIASLMMVEQTDTIKLVDAICCGKREILLFPFLHTNTYE